MSGFEMNFGSTEIFEVEMDFGCKGTNVQDHRLLTGREAEDQHPISSVTGLGKRLSEVEGEELTNLEIERLFKLGGF